MVKTHSPSRLTEQQRKALHLWFSQLAEALRDEGHDMRKVMSYPIIPTKESVKEMIFKPILLAMYGKKSTKDLNKQKEIDTCVDVIVKTFGEMGIIIPAFPSLEEKSLEAYLKTI